MYFNIVAIFLLILPNKYSNEKGSGGIKPLRISYILVFFSERIGQAQNMI